MGEALRLLRVFYGYKSAEMGKLLGISQSYVSEIENGKRTPTLEVIDKYAQIFGMKKSTLFLFIESIQEEDTQNLSKNQRVAATGMKLLKVLEKTGGLENE